LIGGVGSGKTTELLRTAERLKAIEDTHPVFFDASLRHDIGKMKPGIVAVQAGLALADVATTLGLVPKERGVANAISYLRALADGYVDDPDYPDDHDYPYTPGILTPPDPIDESVAAMTSQIETVIAHLKPLNPHFVVLIDGLDRMTDLQSFEQIVRHDVTALRAIGIGVVLAGPLRALYGIDRTILERFDRIHQQLWLDVSEDPENARFLGDVLRRRLTLDELDDHALDLLVRFSGGVARDLLALAQSACVEAYLQGSETIGRDHVEAAVDTFGRKHMQGLRTGELAVLERVRASGQFVGTSEDDFGLLMTRRVLEYRNRRGQPRYVVHPTIEALVAALGIDNSAV
jgi:hypothetical protein